MLVELYTENLLDNVYSSLIYQPEEVVFLFDTQELPESYRDVKRFLCRKLPGITIREQMVDLSNLQGVECMLKGLSCEDIVDLSGGNEYIQFILAKSDTRCKFSICDFVRERHYCYDGSFHIEKLPRLLGFEEYVSLCGAAIKGCESRTHRYETALIRELFALVRKHRQDWTNLVAYLNTCLTNENALRYDAYRIDSGAVSRYRRFFKVFCKYGLCTTAADGTYVFDLDLDRLDLITKSGTILELYLYELLKVTGKCFFIESGVRIRWDDDDVGDYTMNEIDVIAQIGARVLFISCKLTKVETYALNEIYTMSQRFGGGLGEMAVVTLNQLPVGIRNRAEQMECKLIDASRKTDEELLRLLNV